MTDKARRTETLRKLMDENGGVATFAQSLGVTHQAVYQWLKRGYAPPAQAAKISELHNIPVRSIVSPDFLRMLDLTQGN